MTSQPSALSAIARQHLIDPEVCIRCNTCEEACPRDAISHDRRQYAVSFELCDACGDCLPPCPTGAIDSWRQVLKPFSVDEQLGWESLPNDVTPDETQNIPEIVARLTAEATSASGVVPPPWSAAHPYVGLYTLSRPAVATVAGNHRLTDESSEIDIRHIVLDFGKMAFPYLEGQTIGILPPGTDERGRPHHMRLYSIASPRDGERPKHNNLALTVKRVTADHEGRPVKGVASSYLCDLVRGDHVNVVGPYGTSFLMPNHPGAKLLMICTGTGSAPMRAMTERRRRRMPPDQGRTVKASSVDGQAAELLLFFGARKPGELPYFGPLQKLPRDLIDVQLAFSRLPEQEREYVQDRMRSHADEVARFLNDDETFVYICGHKKMEAGVLSAISEILRARGVDPDQRLAHLRREGRFHVETY